MNPVRMIAATPSGMRSDDALLAKRARAEVRSVMALSPVLLRCRLSLRPKPRTLRIRV